MNHEYSYKKKKIILFSFYSFIFSPFLLDANWSLLLLIIIFRSNGYAYYSSELAISASPEVSIDLKKRTDFCYHARHNMILNRNLFLLNVIFQCKLNHTPNKMALN